MRINDASQRCGSSLQAKSILVLIFLLPVSTLPAEEPPAPSETSLLQSIMQRMDALEEENRQMVEELHQLRRQLEAKQASAVADPMQDRVAVTENRVEEQAQTKVEASQKFPITLTGRLLFNAFANTGRLQPLPNSTYPSFIDTANTTGATVRQTMLGFDFRGPTLPGDGKINAHIMLDFYSGIPSEQLDWLRIRTSDISADWQHRSFSFALDKPLISPRQPNSLAEVSIPPLANAGNFWLWLPQIRYEERFKFGANAGLSVQAALIQTDETYNYTPADYGSSLEKTRPAVEGRVAFWKKWNDNRRLELGSGFHESTSHVAQRSVDSRVASIDWLAAPFSKLAISGIFFHGQNFGGLGALSTGYSILQDGAVIPVHGNGGWIQFSTPVTSHLTFNLFSGFQANRARDLSTGSLIENLAYAGNLMLRLSPNVIVSLEALQMRSRLQHSDDLIRNRYDLALAYLF